MPENSENADRRASFVRQRRFLIGTSLTILAYGYLGLSLEKISVLGNSADISQPERLTVVLMIVHLWACYRYWTHFHELAPWRPFREERLHKWRWALTPLDYSRRQRVGEQLAEFVESHHAELTNLRTKERIDIGAVPRNVHLVQVVGNSVATMQQEWNVPYYSTELDQQVGYVTLRIPVGRWLSRYGGLRAWIFVLANRKFTSEYIVPIGLAIVAMVMLTIELLGLSGFTGSRSSMS